MQKRFGVLFVLIAAALAACSGGGGSTTTNNPLGGVVLATPTAAPPTPVPPTAAPDAVNVVVNPSFEGASAPSTVTSPQAFVAGNITNPSPVPVVVPTGWFVCQNLSEDQPTDAGQSPSANTFVQLLTAANLTTIVPAAEGLTTPFNTAPNTLSGSTDTAALMLGNVNAQGSTGTDGLSGRTKGGYGLCQDVIVPTNGLLTFWVNEGSGGTASTTTSTGQIVPVPIPVPTATGSAFGEGSEQEAAILAPASAPSPFTVLMPLFNELDGSQSDPAAYANASLTAIGSQTGWVQKGPYNLSALAGKEVELYFGIYSSSAATTSFTFMLVDDVNLLGIPVTPASHRHIPQSTTVRR
jgi:hypothetical protein